MRQLQLSSSAKKRLPSAFSHEHCSMRDTRTQLLCNQGLKLSRKCNETNLQKQQLVKVATEEMGLPQ